MSFAVRLTPTLLLLLLSASGVGCGGRALSDGAGGSGGALSGMSGAAGSRAPAGDASDAPEAFDCTGAALGTVCAPGVCLDDSVIGRYVCDGRGNCVPGPSVICAPYACDGTTGGCFTACAGNTDCVGGRVCVAGSCLDAAPGTCKAGSECLSGFCVDGFCCDSACAGSCRSCAVPGREGTCSPVPAGAVDPRGVCTDNGAATCGRNGTCDGVGGCANYPAGAVCGVAVCRDGANATFASCNGVGTCVRTTIPCAPFACDPQTSLCRSGCATDLDCAAGAACLNGQCSRREGAACTSDPDCVSGHCAQGVCCQSTCDGICQSCALPGSAGTCAAIPGPDPTLGCSASHG
jgi:hypothetical protein